MAISSVKPIERLKKRPQFLRVAKGAKAAMPGLILQAWRRQPVAGLSAEPCRDTIRIGFTVTGKIGNAVVRNRTKRRLRAAAGRLLSHYGRAGFDYVLVGRTTTQTRPFEALCDDLQKALVRIHQEQKAVNRNR